jgi:uncharacterized OsmC-like protein
MKTVTADLTDSYTVELRTDDHVFTADEPVAVGGHDRGPTPYELLLGALGACTAITLRMVADKEGIPLTSVSARFTFDRIHADDCETCDDVQGFIHHVRGEIFLDGGFSEAQRERLESVARRCPVHKTLEAGIHFTEQVVVG